MKKPLVIYHGDCADGFGARLAFWLKHKDEVEYFPGYYDGELPDVKDREVYFLDFSYKLNVITKLLEEAKHITIIDHHLSAMEDLKDFEHPKLTKHFEMGHSGAVLAYMHCFPGEEVPMFFKYIEDRDIWKFRYPESKDFAAALFSYEYDIEVWNNLYTTMHLGSFLQEGKAILRKQNKDIKELLRQCKRRMTIAGFDVPVASLPYTLASDACHIMAEGESFSACYFDTETLRKFSLRSKENGEDVSKIAVLFGGGGHRSASGFSVPRTHPLAMA